MLRTRWSRWEGTYKLYTKDCKECNFYRKIEGDGLCGKGRTFKYLERQKKIRRCGIKNKTIENSSIRYLDEIIKNPDKYNLIKIPTITQLKLF